MDAKQERDWAIACHLSSLAWIPLSLVGFGAIPFVNLIAPALVWYAKKEESQLIDDHGRESLNFQISMTIYGFAATILLVVSFILVGVVMLEMDASEGSSIADMLVILSGLGIILSVIIIVAIAIFQVVIVSFAAVKTKEGGMYRYPFNLRLLKKYP